MYIHVHVGADVPISSGAEAAEPQIFHPAVVEGKKAVEIARFDGKCPVLDKNIDVFAIPSCTGNVYVCVHVAIMCIIMCIHVRICM